MICRMDSGRKIKDRLSHLINRWLFLKNQGTDDYLLTYYLARMFVDVLFAGQDFSKLRRCIGICILDFNLTEDI